MPGQLADSTCPADETVLNSYPLEVGLNEWMVEIATLLKTGASSVAGIGRLCPVNRDKHDVIDQVTSA